MPAITWFGWFHTGVAILAVLTLLSVLVAYIIGLVLQISWLRNRSSESA